MNRYKARVMGVHCGSKGLGFAVFEGQAIHDWGTVVARGNKNAMALRKLARLMDRFSPEAVVVEDINLLSRRAERIFELYAAIAAYCGVRGVAFYRITKAHVCRCLGVRDGATRQDVAEAVARYVDALAPRLPSPRRPWQSESRRMAIFTAVAVTLTFLADPHTADLRLAS